MKIELVLKSPTVSIPVSFSASSPSGGDARNGLPSGGSNGDILVKNGNTDYDARWEKTENIVGAFKGAGENSLVQNTNNVAQDTWTAALNKDTEAYGGGSLAAGGGSIAGISYEMYKELFAADLEDKSEEETKALYADALERNTVFDGSNYNTIGLRYWFAHAEGEISKAVGRASHAEGFGNSAENDFAHAEGSRNKSRGVASHTEGNQNEANAINAHAEGENNKANGANSHAEGYGNTADAPNAHAEGRGNTIGEKAEGAHIEGGWNSATGSYSHIEGQGNKASASFAHIEGINNEALHSRAHIEGQNNKSSAANQHVLGKYCKDSPNAVVIVGNGDADTPEGRSNAYELDWSGNAKFSGRVTCEEPTTAKHATTKQYVDTNIAAKLAELVNSAPATLDTLAEIAKALGDDPNFATTILTELGKKAYTEDVEEAFAQTNEALAGKSAVKVGGEVVAEFDADTKLDKLKNNNYQNAVYCIRTDGTHALWSLGSTPNPWGLVTFTGAGTTKTNTATEGNDTVPLAQMNEALTEKASAKTVDNLSKKVENLEAGLAPDMFVVDDTTAYVKTIPTDAAPYAELRAVGGMTHKVEQFDYSVPFNASFAENEWYAEYVTASPDGTVVFGYHTQSISAGFDSFFPSAVVGKKYMLSVDASGGYLQAASVYTDLPLDTPFVLTEEQYDSTIHLSAGIDDNGEAGVPVDSTFTFSLREATDVLLDTPVTALETKDASGNVTNTFAIPAEVQALDGYGKTGYGIGWDEQGKPWWVTPNARTDISAYFTEDNLIPVEGGGTITAVNEHGFVAPTTIVYQATGQSLADAFDEVHEYAMQVIGGNA